MAACTIMSCSCPRFCAANLHLEIEPRKPSCLRPVFIPGPLPGMNEIIKAAKSGRGRSVAYARMKAKWTAIARDAFLLQRVSPVKSCRLSLIWSEPNRRRNPDNICAGVKFVIDGMVAAGVISNDGWGQIVSITHDWIDELPPYGVLITITEGI